MLTASTAACSAEGGAGTAVTNGTSGGGQPTPPACPKGGILPNRSPWPDPVAIGPTPDAILVDGQSNALGSVYYANMDKPCLESGVEGQDLLSWSGSALVPADGNGQGKIYYTDQSIGLWAAHFGRALIEHGWRAAIINRSVAGKPISYFLPGDMSGHYAEVLLDVQSSKVVPRALVWSQGEADGTLMTSQAAYQSMFATLHKNWLHDFPGIDYFVVIKTAAGACGADTTTVRAAQDDFAHTFDDVTIVDVDDLTGDKTYHTGCHYTYAGYKVFAARASEKILGCSLSIP